MRAPTMAVTAPYWTVLLEAFYTGLEGLDASGYAWDPSDGWTQSRSATSWTAHLEAWVDLGGSFTLTRDAYLHDGSLAFALRFHADDDSISQSRMHAAAHDAAEFLLRATLPHGCRVVSVNSVAFAGPMPSGYVECTLTFSLYVPR